MNTDTTPATTESPLFNESHRATYCPEDNKLRLYVGRVSRPEYEALRAQGWTSTPKQDCDFVAHWTPARRDMAQDYAGIIEDEDQSPAERAADRAERFAGYLGKRLDEATGHADRFDAGPSAHGFQNLARAERSAARHDRIAGRAVDAWDKAEYWQSRTAGVISHALHVSSPSVRMGRIKELEADIRKAEKRREEYAARFAAWTDCAAMPDGSEKNKIAQYLAGSGGIFDYKHPRPEEVTNSHVREKGTSLWSLLTLDREGSNYGKPITAAEACAIWLARNSAPNPEGPWLTHYRNRLAYETQMLEAQGGRAGAVEMVAGGFILYSGCFGRSPDRWVRIQKVNKSTASGRVTSVMVKASGDRWGNTSEGFHMAQIDVERMSPESYRAPTPEELTAFTQETKTAKAAAKAAKPTPPPLVNPTDEDAERLQALWNEKARAAFFERNPHYNSTPEYFKPSTVKRITQATYSANSGGSFSKASTCNLCGGGMQEPTSYNYNGKLGPVLAKIRTTYGDGNTTNAADSVIIITDKPQKPLPASVWLLYAEPAEATTEPKSCAGRDSRGLSYSVNG